MFRIFSAEKDTYITDRVISGKRSFASNTGRAGTLDVLKLFGVSKSGSLPNAELSRVLIKFDYTTLISALSSSGRDITDPSFNVQLKLHDVYSGHTTPANFNIVAYPLSQSFDEGTGRDVGYYHDYDVANFLTSSWSGGPITWHASGANGKGLLGSSDIDTIASGNIGRGIVPLGTSQSFVKGTEDLVLDITRIVSATLVGLIPDKGFRISFIPSEEDDGKSRFVKRFGSRSAADVTKRPQLIVRWNDAIQDDRNNMTFDMSGTLFLYNNSPSGLKNVVSGAALTPIVGSNCMRVRLETAVSGAIYSSSFLASQLRSGNTFVSGTYLATVSLPSSDPLLREQLLKSGSVTFTEYWSSLDSTIGFMTSSIVLRALDTQTYQRTVSHNVSISMADEFTTDQVVQLRTFIQLVDSTVILRKMPRESVNYIPGETHFSVRDANTDDVIIPFDETRGSTRLSTDSGGSLFTLYMDTFVPGHVYVVDLLIKEGTRRTIYKSVGGPFRVQEPH